MIPTHAIHHGIIGASIGLLAASVGPCVIGDLIPQWLLLWSGAAFYTVRELHQYFIQGKRHRGRFDWEGLTAPYITTGLTVLLIHLMLT